MVNMLTEKLIQLCEHVTISGVKSGYTSAYNV